MFPAILTLRRGVDKQAVRLMTDRTAANSMASIWRQEASHAKLLRKAFLIGEAENIEDYRALIMSTFGKVLTFDSTKKICKKLAGAGCGTAEWCTNVGNELSQVLTSVLSVKNQFRSFGPWRRASSTGTQKLGKVHLSGTDHHPKYALFKSALSAAVFAYHNGDMAVLVKAIRAGSRNGYENLPDGQIIAKYVSKDDLKHFVRRVTVGAQATFAQVQNTIDVLTGPAGLDENGISLFKDKDAIHQDWTTQQKHLECIQDPAGMNMYTVTKHVTRNGVSMPFYVNSRGTVWRGRRDQLPSTSTSRQRNDWTEYLFSQSADSFNDEVYYREAIETLQTADAVDKDDEVSDRVEEAEEMQTGDDGYKSEEDIIPSNVQINLTDDDV
ncbi:hypothetical protein BSL78_14580 [Apostichopus japonicus]|uniref:Uncharacterized protein n=1 Tax=Stichopus japonicus TaxID=307972 RepID=A0A2G8KKR0_STIJA|nr:hypothetical protein BSL78_14580 [Apostichopus japonicus]